MLVFAVVLFTRVVAAQPTTWVVNSSADPGDGVCTATECTLREAIAASASGDTVQFDLPLPATITLTVGALVVSHDLSIIGPGADRLAISGNDLHRVFYIGNSVPAVISGLTIRDGRTDGTNGLHSAGIRNFGYLVVIDSAIIDNHALTDNGGIGTSKRLTLINSLVAGNTAGFAAGGIGSDAELIVINSTISGNTAGNHAGGIKANQGYNPTRFVLLNSTVVSNASGARSGDGILINTPTTLGNNIILGNLFQDCLNGRGDTVSLGYSLVGRGCPTTGPGDTPVSSSDVFTQVLDANLSDNGGPTWTHALLPGSPAIDGGDPAGCFDDLGDPISADQRGVARPYDGDSDGDAVCDPGAFEAGAFDTDGDGVSDLDDNCPNTANPEQTDTDLDGEGDACDADDDGDGVADPTDNCPFTANTDQEDLDLDGLGDACDSDPDGDGVGDDPGEVDNCPLTPNPFQDDTDGDLAGDACDEDDDNDGICDTDQTGSACAAGPDNCSTVPNPDQDDLDGDGIGDTCDADLDGDGVGNGSDNCQTVTNPAQDDADGDGNGDACDVDDDEDGVLDDTDNCQFLPNYDQTDTDGDGQGDVCDGDLDGDGWDNATDNCPTTANSDQNDMDGDLLGDACDDDIDGDGADNGVDICAGTQLGAVVDPASGCSIEQLCPCAGPRGTSIAWKNHGKYVSCVARAAEDFVEAGLISESDKDATVSEAGQSTCGSKK